MGGADQASLDAIRGETDRMIRLVGDLLLLAQADAGLPMRREPIAIDQLAGEVVRQVQVISGGVKVSLHSEVSEPLCVDGDPDRLRQLLLNLIDNAIKYTPSGGEVKVRVARENGSARLDVSRYRPGHSARTFAARPQRCAVDLRAILSGGEVTHALGCVERQWPIGQRHRAGVVHRVLDRAGACGADRGAAAKSAAAQP